MSSEKQYLKEEIRKEFQLERMILFSDAVFAIGITLMAIEIKLPEHVDYSADTLPHELLKLVPLFIAYAASFFFIGKTWYEHLRIFSLLKDFDKGLVVRNLFMLFFIGLFPFSVTLVSRPHNTSMIPVIIYFSVIMLCSGSQLMLQHYILIKKPALRIQTDIQEALLRFKKTRLVIIILTVTFIFVLTTLAVIEDPLLKPIAWCWFMIFPFFLKYFYRRIEKQMKAATG
jgi:uncharacterized membrane protein